MQEIMQKWWGKLGFAILLLGLSVFLYIDLTKFEEEGGSRRMNRLVVGLYQLGGKWTVTGVFGAGGIAAAAWAIHQLVTEKKDGEG